MKGLFLREGAPRAKTNIMNRKAIYFCLVLTRPATFIICWYYESAPVSKWRLTWLVAATSDVSNGNIMWHTGQLSTAFTNRTSLCPVLMLGLYVCSDLFSGLRFTERVTFSSVGELGTTAPRPNSAHRATSFGPLHRSAEEPSQFGTYLGG